MDEKLRKQVRKRHGYKCRICGIKETSYSELEVHHIFFGNGVRQETEMLECLSYLCHTCHVGNYKGDMRAVHQNIEIDLYLKQYAQVELLDQVYTEDEVREITGGEFYL